MPLTTRIRIIVATLSICLMLYVSLFALAATASAYPPNPCLGSCQALSSMKPNYPPNPCLGCA